MTVLRHIRVLTGTETTFELELTPDDVFKRPITGELVGFSKQFLNSNITNPAKPNSCHMLEHQVRLQLFADATMPLMGCENVPAGIGPVQQANFTLQSMFFEPEIRTVHVAFGTGPKTGHAPPLCSDERSQ